MKVEISYPANIAIPDKQIIFHLTRIDCSFFVHQYIPYLKLLKETMLKNAYHKDVLNANLLITKMIIILSNQVELLMQKKLVNTNSTEFKLKLNEAQAIAFLQMLQKIPVDANQYYILNLLNSWIHCLHKQIN